MASNNIEHSKMRSAPINLRALPEQRLLIDRAARVLGKKRSEFILEASCLAAEDVLLDQRLFLLNDADFNDFEALLNEPVKDNPTLRKLMESKAPWDK